MPNTNLERFPPIIVSRLSRFSASRRTCVENVPATSNIASIKTSRRQRRFSLMASSPPLPLEISPTILFCKQNTEPALIASIHSTQETGTIVVVVSMKRGYDTMRGSGGGGGGGKCFDARVCSACSPCCALCAVPFLHR